MRKQRLSRRDFLQISAGATMGTLLAACAAPEPEIVKEEVIVKETVVVEGEVVEVEKVVTATAPPAEKPEIVYYDRASQATAWGDAYNEAQDEVTLTVTIRPPGETFEQLIAAIMAGNAPDVIGLDCVHIGRFSQLGALVPLEDLIPQDTLDSYFQSLVTTDHHYGISGGHLYGVPFWVDCSVCYYNKAFLEEAGGDPELGFQSWDDHVIYGKEAVKQGRFGFSTGRVNDFLFGPWIWAQGGDFTDAEWTRSRCDEPPVRNILQFGRDIVCVHKITNDAPAADWNTMTDIFTGQKAMSVYHGGGLVGLTRSEFPELFEVLGTCPIPGPEVGQKSSAIGGNVASISTQSEHREEALDFVLWVTASDEGMAVTGEVGFLPGCPSGLDLPVYQKDAAIYAAFKEALETGYALPNDPRFWEVIVTPPSLAWEEAILCEKPMDEIVSRLHNTINEILQR